jgi:hypothetical protein
VNKKIKERREKMRLSAKEKDTARTQELETELSACKGSICFSKYYLEDDFTKIMKIVMLEYLLGYATGRKEDIPHLPIVLGKQTLYHYASILQPFYSIYQNEIAGSYNSAFLQLADEFPWLLE